MAALGVQGAQLSPVTKSQDFGHQALLTLLKTGTSSPPPVLTGWTGTSMPHFSPVLTLLETSIFSPVLTLLETGTFSPVLTLLETGISSPGSYPAGDGHLLAVLLPDDGGRGRADDGHVDLEPLAGAHLDLARAQRVQVHLRNTARQTRDVTNNGFSQ